MPTLEDSKTPSLRLTDCIYQGLRDITEIPSNICWCRLKDEKVPPNSWEYAQAMQNFLGQQTDSIRFHGSSGSREGWEQHLQTCASNGLLSTTSKFLNAYFQERNLFLAWPCKHEQEKLAAIIRDLPSICSKTFPWLEFP